MEGKLEVVEDSNKQKVDTINPTPIKPDHNQAESRKPLASVIKPDMVSKTTEIQRKEEQPKKKSFLFRDIFGIEKERNRTKSERIQSPKKKLQIPHIFKKSEPSDEKPTKKSIIKPHHKKIALGTVVFGVLVSLIILVIGALYAHQSIYANKVYPGVMVWGEDVGGKSMTEVQQLVTEKIKSYKISLAGPDQNYVAVANDLGLIFNSETMALSAFSKGRTGSFWNNYWTRARLLGTRINWEPSKRFFRSNELEILPSYQVDEKKLDEYINKISGNINIPAKDSEVKIVSGNTELIPAIYGREVTKESLKKNLKEKIGGFRSGEVKIETKQVKPNIVDNSAQEVLVRARSVMSRPVTLTYQGQIFKPNKETIASWIVFIKPSGAQNYNLVIDPARMKNYFAFLGTKINIYPVSRKVQIENGAKETVLQEGKDGLLIDETALGRNIAAQLPNQSAVSLTIPTYVAKYKTEFNHVLIANWSKYLGLNLSTQTLTAYLQGGQVVGSWKVTTGNRYHPTPTGTRIIQGKSAITRMTGGTRGIDYYDLPNVHWVSWLGGGYSIHEAYWRSSFGGMDYVWNGSHGCINAPLSVARFIYDWASIGTPVIIHY